MESLIGAGIAVLILAVIAVGTGLIMLIASSFMKNDKRTLAIGKRILLYGSLGLLLSLTLCSVGAFGR